MFALVDPWEGVQDFLNKYLLNLKKEWGPHQCNCIIRKQKDNKNQKKQKLSEPSKIYQTRVRILSAEADCS